RRIQGGSGQLIRARTALLEASRRRGAFLFVPPRRPGPGRRRASAFAGLPRPWPPSYFGRSEFRSPLMTQPLQSFHADALPVRVFPGETEMSEAVACEVRDYLLQLLQTQGSAAAILATG